MIAWLLEAIFPFVMLTVAPVALLFLYFCFEALVDNIRLKRHKRL